MKRGLAILVVIVLAALLIFNLPLADRQELKDEEKLFGLSVVWKNAAEVFGYWELVPDLNWDQAYLDFIPRVLDTKDLHEYYSVLNEFVALLQDGHSGVGSDVLNGTHGLPVFLRFMEDRYVVAIAGKKTKFVPGTEIIKVNGQEISAYLEDCYGATTGLQTYGARQDQLLQKLWQQNKGGTVTLTGVLPDGAEVEEKLRYVRNPFPSRTDWQSFEIEYEKTAFAKKYRSFQAYLLAGDIYLVVLPDFNDDRFPQEFHDFMEQVRDDAQGFIFDARENGGGSSYNAIELLSYFVPVEELNYGTSYVQYKNPYYMSSASAYHSAYFAELETIEENRLETMSGHLQEGERMLENRFYKELAEAEEDEDGYETYYRVNPGMICDQPVFLLSGWWAGSAGDDFFAYAKGLERFTIIGTNTRGTTGQLHIVSLPGGGELYLSCKRDVMADGSDLINRGVQPDVWVEQSVEDAVRGVDTVLKYAHELMLELLEEGAG